MLTANPAVPPLRLVLLLALAVASTALGWNGLIEAVRASPDYVDATSLDVAYFTAQLFVLSSEPISGVGPYPLSLEFARVLAPLTTALAVIEAVYTVARERIDRWRLSRRRGHAIVTGDTPAAWALAARLAERVAVNVITEDTSQRPQSRGTLRVVVGDAEEAATLRAAGIGRANMLYACADEGSRNVGVGLLARQLSRRGVAVMARSADDELVAALRARRLSKVDSGDGFSLDFFAIESLAARALVDEHQRFFDRPDSSVTVVGSSTFGRAVAREALDRTARTRTQPITWVVGDEVPARGFLARYGLADHVRFVTDLGAEGGDDVIFVCLDDTDDGLRVGLRQVRAGVADVVVCLPARSAIGDALGPEAVFDNMDNRLSVFGILDAACEPTLIDNDLVDQLARGVHQQYVESCEANGDTVNTNPNMVGWDKLPVDMRASNYEQAQHIATKLDAIDAVIIPSLDGLAPFQYKPGEVTRLAMMEHLRWAESQRRRGVVHGEERRPGISHPDFKPWAELDNAAKQKNIDFVETIPDLLATKRLAILRRPN